jgi:hypothetical protein
MARTKQKARVSTGGPAPRRPIGSLTPGRSTRNIGGSKQSGDSELVTRDVTHDDVSSVPQFFSICDPIFII